MIVLGPFKGEIPQSSDILLPDGCASSAVNCDLQSGQLKPINGVSHEQDVDAGAETIYRLGEDWLQWNNKVNVIESPVYDSGGRIAFTGDGYAKETNLTLGVAASPYPSATRRLGIAAPTAAPTATVTVTGSSSDEKDISYCYTRVGQWADGTVVESAPSLPTDVETIKADATVQIDDFVDSSETGVYTTHYRIYRINVGSTGAEFQYVAEITKATLSHDDDHATKTDDDLGEVLPTEGWTEPVENLGGLILTSNGIAFGFHDNRVFPSEAFIPYTFPIEYALSVGSEVVGLGDIGSAVVVLTKTNPSLIFGTDPGSLSLEKLSYDYPCKSARSIVSVPGGVLYASSFGLILINISGEALNVTDGVFTESQWRDLGPENIFAFHYDDAYLAFFNGTDQGIEVRVGEGTIRRFTLEREVWGGDYVSTVRLNSHSFFTSAGDNFITADGYQLVVAGDSYSISYDKLYLIQTTASGGRAIVAWGEGSAVDYQYESSERLFSDQIIISAGKISGDFSSGSVDIELYVDGVLHFSKTVTDSKVFRIPRLRGNRFKVALSGQAILDKVVLGRSVQETVRLAYAA